MVIGQELGLASPGRPFIRSYSGKDGVSKTDEFSEKFQKGGGSFPIQKFMLQIFAIINAS